MISEKGTIEGNGAIRLLLGVHQLKHTGILYMKNDDVLKVLYFNRGRLLWAISNAGEDQLETVLIRHGVVNADGLRAVKEDLPVNESIGKRLVEMNILTLDDLVRYTRIQLQQIVFSVINWQQGGFQFVKDSPPQRLLSLDLDLTELVAAFILKRIEMNRIWEEIGSFQTVLVPCKDQERIEATGLTASQEKLLHSFDGRKDLSAVVSRYADEHQDSLLKVVFYLICAGLLSMNVDELPDSQAVEEAFDTVGLLFADEKGMDSSEPEDSYRFSSSSQKMGMEENERQPATRDIAPIKDEIPLSLLKKSAPVVDDFPDESAQEGADDLTDSLFPQDKVRTRRLSNWIYLVVLGIMIVGGTVLIMITRGEESRILTAPMTFEEATEKSKTERIEIGRPEPEDTAVTSPLPEEAVLSQSRPANVRPQEQKEATDAEKPVLIPMKEVKTSEDPWIFLHSGRFEDAGHLWSKQIKAEGVNYSILLELDCLIKSVQLAVGQFSDPKDLFILNRRHGERNCFLVMWGRFADQASAEAAYSAIPDYFLRQENPPKVIALAPYL